MSKSFEPLHRTGARARIFLSGALGSLSFALACAGASAQNNYPGVGRSATPAEVKAWDIDVRPDFKGLPTGSGSVAKGQEVWESKCASCHGTFGESNEVSGPIVGGTTAADIKTGRVASLTGGEPQRTTLMKLSSLSTLWDFINRAMPWTAPKTLTTEEVYAVVAYILRLADIVPGDFVLSDQNMQEAQNRLPNRNGITRDHGLWNIKDKPDVANTACMRNCVTEVKIASALPEHAHDAHGDLAEQNRTIGPARGVPPKSSAVSTTTPITPAKEGQDIQKLAVQNGCMACHGVNNKIVGPAFSDVAAKYKGDSSAPPKLAEKLKLGGAGVWGNVPMPGNPTLSEADGKSLVTWILSAGQP